MQAQQREYPAFLSIETKPLPAWLPTVPRVEPERPTRWVWIVLGVALLFGFVIGGGYWLSQRGASPPGSPIKPARMAAVPPSDPPVSRLVVGLPALSGPTTSGSVVAQPQVPAPRPPPRLAVGLPPITGQSPSDAPAPEPVVEAPPPAEPLPSPAPIRQPHRKASAHQTSPVAGPGQSAGVVKF
jgi:hypothetical protein